MIIKVPGAFLVSILLAVAIACGATATEPAPTQPSATVESTTPPTSTREPEVVVAFSAGPCLTTEAVPLPIEFEYMGTIPTGFDGINKATCTFTKAVQTLQVVLTGPATHTEVFTLSEPTTEVAFPLPEGTLSISTLEIVPAGEYQRQMTVTSVDGETLVISDQPGVLETVTIIEPQS